MENVTAVCGNTTAAVRNGGLAMSLVKRKIFICDHCGAIELAERYDCSFSYRLPYGWGEFGRNHLCPKCYSAWKAWKNLKNQAESESDNG